MRISEVITESLSRIAFHYTSNVTALKILQSGNFELSSALGSVEEMYMPKGKPYFLSTTRTRMGGYHAGTGTTRGVLFVLNGDWFNQHYVSRAVDYWENRNPQLAHHRTSEAEDRVFSAEPTIPLDGVRAIHVYLAVDASGNEIEAHSRAVTRELLISAKTRGIPTFFYTDRNAWLHMDSRHQGDVKLLTGQRDPSWSRRKRKAYMQPWIDLMLINDPKKLNADADRLRYNLSYTYNKDHSIRDLNNEMSNARKPGYDENRYAAVRIISYMRQNKLNNMTEFVDHIAEKWKNIISQQQRNQVK